MCCTSSNSLLFYVLPSLFLFAYSLSHERKRRRETNSCRLRAPPPLRFLCQGGQTPQKQASLSLTHTHRASNGGFRLCGLRLRHRRRWVGRERGRECDLICLLLPPAISQSRSFLLGFVPLFIRKAKAPVSVLSPPLDVHLSLSAKMSFRLFLSSLFPVDRLFLFGFVAAPQFASLFPSPGLFSFRTL